ncbi:MAG: ribonuclease P [Thermoplasmata archaeon]
MTQIARERIADLLGMATERAAASDFAHADRYVALAREIGRRYNVRIPPELKERFCPGCLAYWSEGRTVRTRLRRTGRVRTCLRCGRIRRIRWGPHRERGKGPAETPPPPAADEEEALATEPSEPPEGD